MGCSGSSDSASNNGKDEAPQNATEALSRLSAEHRRNFENWKKNIVKSCNATEAFVNRAGEGATPKGVDSIALMNKNNGSVVFTDDDHLLVLTSHSSFPGVSQTSFQERLEINGREYELSAKAKREGHSCKLYLSGHKVFETHIAQSFTVGAQWLPDRDFTVNSQSSEIQELRGDGLGELVETGLNHFVSEVFTPTNKAYSLLASKLGIKEEQVSDLFHLSHHSSINSTIRIHNLDSAIWSHQSEASLIAYKHELKQYFNGEENLMTLEIRLPIPEFSFLEIKNDSDNGSLKFLLDLKISPTDDDSFVYTGESSDFSGFKLHDENEALSCLESRVLAYIEKSTVNQIRPSVQKSFAPCRAFHSQVEEKSYSRGIMQSLIPKVFAGVTPSERFLYQGWDQVLSRLVLDTLEEEMEIQGQLDPSFETSIVEILEEHLLALKFELEQAREMSDYRDEIFNVGLDWSFRGQRVSPARVNTIIKSLDNSINPFEVSSFRLLNNLRLRPYSNDIDLSFAQSINSAYKSQALQALSLAIDLSYDEFQTQVFNRVIQERVTVNQLKEWTSNLEGIKSEIDQYTDLDQVKADLVGLSIKWIRSGEASIQQLNPIYSAFNNSIKPFDTSTNQLINSLREDISSNREALEFARSLTDEYKQLALKVKEKSASAHYENWSHSFFDTILQNRPDIKQLRSWSEMWKAVPAFIQREEARATGHWAFSNRSYLDKVIETALEETWSSKEFEGLETIAEFAQLKGACTHRRGASSLANCAGMKLFSKQEGMFFNSSFGSRYIDLSREFVSHMSKLPGSGWFTLTRNLTNKFFDSSSPIWSKCDESTFARKASDLRDNIDAVVRESNFVRRRQLEREIIESMNNCQ